MTSPVSRPPIRYHGGKWLKGGWILSYFPPHTCYVEAFAGGASLLFQKQPARFEVLNDLDSDVINFFRVLREQPDELIRMIELTPYAREELRAARNGAPTDDPIEKARQFYIRCWQSFGSGQGKSSTGWRFQIGTSDTRTSAIGSWNRTEHLREVVSRLKHVQIDCGDYRDVMKRFDSKETLFYLDPPYVHCTRNSDNAKYKGYQHEMIDGDHRDLAAVARSVQGHVIVSGYASPLYDELYEGWVCVRSEARNLTAKMQTECLWLSSSVTAMSTLPLFRGVVGD